MLPPPPPPPLLDELVEEVLLRFPPENPAGLVRAALVCRRWRRLVSDPGFRRRFRKFHRSPPILGMLCNGYDYRNNYQLARFIPTTSFRSPRTDFVRLRALDARHGRVLFSLGSVLAVWNPITNEVRDLPLPQELKPWTAAVLCSAAAGACGHLDCHHGPFLVVFVCFKNFEAFVYTYSSDAAIWSEPVCAQQCDYFVTSWTGSALVGNALYFGNLLRCTALKYNLELRRTSLIRLPLPLSLESRLITTEDGGLGFITKDVSKLYMWSWKDTHEVDAIWEKRSVIELKTVFPADVVLKTHYLIGSAEGIGIIFTTTGDEVYAIDLKTYKAKKVYEGKTYSVVAYVSFCTPALGGTCAGEGPSASFSSA